MTLSFLQRTELAVHPVTKRLFSIMHTKKTRLCVSADVTTKAALLQLASDVGPHICVLKTHIDIISDFDMDLIRQLKALSEKHNFLLFEDRKFADIGHTVHYQYGGGIYRIAEWADIVNAHTVSGPGIIDGLRTVNPQLALLLLAQMSSQGSLATGDYVTASLAMAREHADVVIGLVAQERLLQEPSWVVMTPGIKLSSEGDGLGQHYKSPQTAIAAGSDVLIVGRGIIDAQDRYEVITRYKEACLVQ